MGKSKNSLVISWIPLTWSSLREAGVGLLIGLRTFDKMKCADTDTGC
jgi:hypothetical protein